MKMKLDRCGGDDTTSAIRLSRPDDLAERSLSGSPGAGGDPRQAVAIGLCSAGRKLILDSRILVPSLSLSKRATIIEEIWTAPRNTI